MECIKCALRNIKDCYHILRDAVSTSSEGDHNSNDRPPKKESHKVTIGERDIPTRQSKKEPRTVTIGEQDTSTSMHDVSLALVLKAKEGKGLKNQAVLDCEIVTQLLDNASYFLCISRPKMEEKWEKLHCDKEINFLSEQPIVVRIDLQHREPPGQFRTKLELKIYLKECGTKFEYGGNEALTKPIIITEVGFQRS